MPDRRCAKITLTRIVRIDTYCLQYYFGIHHIYLQRMKSRTININLGLQPAQIIKNLIAHSSAGMTGKSQSVALWKRLKHG